MKKTILNLLVPSVFFFGYVVSSVMIFLSAFGEFDKCSGTSGEYYYMKMCNEYNDDYLYVFLSLFPLDLLFGLGILVFYVWYLFIAKKRNSKFQIIPLMLAFLYFFVRMGLWLLVILPHLHGDSNLNVIP